MGKMKEFAQDLAEAMGFENITKEVLEIGQEVLDAKGNLAKVMNIARRIRKERWIHICSCCKRYKSGNEWINPILKIDNWKILPLRLYPQGKQTHTFCPECHNKFYKDEIEAGILKAV